MILELNPVKWFANARDVLPYLKSAADAVLPPVDFVGQATEVSNSGKPVESDMASIFAKIENAEKSTAAWLEKKLTEIEGKAPTIERVIDASLGYIGPALQIGLTAIGDAPIAAEVGTVVAKAQSDLLTASALVTDFGPTPTAASMFASVKTNLSALLTASQVTNKTTVATVTKAVNEVGLLASAVQTAATNIVASATAPAKA